MGCGRHLRQVAGPSVELLILMVLSEDLNFRGIPKWY